MAPGFWQIVIVLLIVLLLFGTKRLRNIGSDLGAAIKSFRSGMADEDDKREAGRLSSDKPAAADQPAERSAAERHD